jgi:phosphate butyryltransferase
MLKKIDELFKLAKAAKKTRLVVVFAHDENVIEAVQEAVKLCGLELILIGDGMIIKSLLKKYEIDTACQIIDITDPVLATETAMNLINNHQADILMKGLIDTKILLKGVVNKEYGIREASLLSHIGLVSYPNFDRVLFATDGAMNIEPSVEEKIMIIENAVALAHSLGYPEPKVGLVSAVEKVNPKIKSTVDSQAILAHYKSNPPRGFIIDGPFAIDNLVSIEAAKHKGIESPVAGHADILLFPQLDGGNIFYKTSVFLAGGESAGIIFGAKVPIVLTSRADSAKAKLLSILLAVVKQDGLLVTSN